MGSSAWNEEACLRFEGLIDEQSILEFPRGSRESEGSGFGFGASGCRFQLPSPRYFCHYHLEEKDWHQDGGAF